MGVYAERVLPRIINVACGMKESRPLRERACAGLHGQVVEIGFGTGHNVSVLSRHGGTGRRRRAVTAELETRSEPGVGLTCRS
jgi:hypothetical protein